MKFLLNFTFDFVLDLFGSDPSLRGERYVPRHVVHAVCAVEVLLLRHADGPQPLLHPVQDPGLRLLVPVPPAAGGRQCAARVGLVPGGGLGERVERAAGEVTDPEGALVVVLLRGVMGVSPGGVMRSVHRGVPAPSRVVARLSRRGRPLHRQLLRQRLRLQMALPKRQKKMFVNFSKIRNHCVAL